MRVNISIILLLFGFWGVQPLQAAAEINEHSPEFKKAASQFMCQCGCNQDVYACSMESCGVNDMFKKDLTEKLNQDMSIFALQDYYTGMYGEEILTAPRKKGFGLLVWVIPFIALAIGAGIYFFFLKKNTHATEENEADEQEIRNEEASKKIDEERKKYF